MTPDEYKRSRAKLAKERRDGMISKLAIPGLPVDGDIPALRGRQYTAANAFGAAEDAIRDLLREKNPFWDGVVENWKTMFPETAARPGRLEGDVLYLYVPSAVANFANRRRLPVFRKTLQALPGAPAKLAVRLEIHS